MKALTLDQIEDCIKFLTLDRKMPSYIVIAFYQHYIEELNEQKQRGLDYTTRDKESKVKQLVNQFIEQSKIPVEGPITIKHDSLIVDKQVYKAHIADILEILDALN